MNIGQNATWRGVMIMAEQERLLNNIDKIHTTELGAMRIKHNLGLDTDDVVGWCKNRIQRRDAQIERRGKNWYISVDGCMITVNAHSFTLITAHKLKKLI